MAQAVQRISQRDRRRTARAKVLASAVECLIDEGYSGASTTHIAERAGVSRGAQLHYFPTRAELFSAAIEHLAHERTSQLEADALALPAGRARVTAALDLLWECFTGPLQEAALELWTASRTDADLQHQLVGVERAIGTRIVEVARGLFAPEVVSAPGFDEHLLTALNAMRGLALIHTYEQDPARLRRQWLRTRRVLRGWFEYEG